MSRYALLLLTMLLTACGQSGDLYLPDQPDVQPPAPVPVPGTTSVSPATTEPDGKKKD